MSKHPNVKTQSILNFKTRQIAFSRQPSNVVSYIYRIWSNNLHSKILDLAKVQCIQRQKNLNDYHRKLQALFQIS